MFISKLLLIYSTHIIPNYVLGLVLLKNEQVAEFIESVQKREMLGTFNTRQKYLDKLDDIIDSDDSSVVEKIHTHIHTHIHTIDKMLYISPCFIMLVANSLYPAWRKCNLITYSLLKRQFNYSLQ